MIPSFMGLLYTTNESDTLASLEFINDEPMALVAPVVPITTFIFYAVIECLKTFHQPR